MNASIKELIRVCLDESYKDTKSPHAELDGAVEDYSGSQFKANCPG